MTTGSILLAIALLIVLLLYLLRPFLAQPFGEAATPYQKLQSQKNVLLSEIRGLDFDHNQGKVPEDVYHSRRTQLIYEAATILQQMDKQTAVSDIDTAIETAVAQLRQTQPIPTAGNCPNCDEPITHNDNFCAVCGQKLQEVSDA